METVQQTPDIQEEKIAIEDSQGVHIEADLLHVAQDHIAFQVLEPGIVFRVSEAIPKLTVNMPHEVSYCGRATISSVIDTGTAVTCEATLDGFWEASPNLQASTSYYGEQLVKEFLAHSVLHRVVPDFKLAVADLQMLLHDLQRATEQLELRVLAEPSRNRKVLEREVLDVLFGKVQPILQTCFERFEHSAKNIPEQQRAAHASYVKRQLHPLVLCAPFMYRTFRKPLGYAGDYEMVNMMLRDPFEGASTYAKLLNAFFLHTPPVIAHRNRVEELERVLISELAQNRKGQRARVLNIGCGPAKEIERLVTGTSLADRADFTLLDFNQETLNYVERTLTEAIRRTGRTTRVKLVRRNITQMLKEAARTGRAAPAEPYDLVYCAGLLDYMSPAVCRRIIAYGYDILAPGGLLLITNVDRLNPSTAWMELAVDWHLMYRSCHEFQQLVPAGIPSEQARSYGEFSGVNIFLEIRKPSNV